MPDDENRRIEVVGKLLMILFSADNPPAEAPITIISRFGKRLSF